MGLAVQTVVALIANPGATATAAAAANGDSLTVKNFNQQAGARLDAIVRGGATAGLVRVVSSQLADTTRGITIVTDKTGTVYELPREVGQPLYSGDGLTVSLTGGTAETDIAALTMYYNDLPGTNALLAQFADLKGSIVNIKPVTVAITVNATVGQWKDTVITTTEDLLRADTYYAVLGVNTDAALDVIGVSGPDTGNLRIALPGSDDTFSVTDGFSRLSERHGCPYIPIINANNKGSTFLSVAHHATGTTANAQLILAQLEKGFSPPGA